jgi:hypothetical protein
MSSAAHEMAGLEAKAIWRIQLWSEITKLRADRQNRLAAMLVDSGRGIRWSGLGWTLGNSSWGAHWSAIINAMYTPDGDVKTTGLSGHHLCRHLARRLEAACEKLLDVDFRP